MSVAERGRAYRKRKKLAAARTLSSATSSVLQFIQERTNAELRETLRQALTERKRYPRPKVVRQRLAQVVAKFDRRYPLGGQLSIPYSHHPSFAGRDGTAPGFDEYYCTILHLFGAPPRMDDNPLCEH